MTSWRDVLKTHPAAELFPSMGAEELKALGEDIKKHGMTSPVVIWWSDDGEPYLLDGRNRLDALEAAGFQIETDTEFVIDIAGHHRLAENGELLLNVLQHSTEDDKDNNICGQPIPDPFAYAISANLHRRHLTAEQKREVTDKRLRATPELSDRAIAKEIEVDHKTVGARRKKLEAGGEIPHLDKRTGADSKAQSATKRPKPITSPPPSPITREETSEEEISDEEFFDDEFEEELNVPDEEVVKAGKIWESGRTDLIESVLRPGGMSFDAALERIELDASSAIAPVPEALSNLEVEPPPPIDRVAIAAAALDPLSSEDAVEVFSNWTGTLDAHRLQAAVFCFSGVLSFEQMVEVYVYWFCRLDPAQRKAAIIYFSGIAKPKFGKDGKINLNLDAALWDHAIRSAAAIRKKASEDSE